MLSDDAVLAYLDSLDGPSPAELAAIELEQPLITAELEITDIEAAMLTADTAPTELDWRRLRRAEHRKLQALADLLTLTACHDGAALRKAA